MLTSRRLLVLGVSAALTLVAGCSSSADAGEGTETSAGSPAADGAYPVTVESIYGPVTLESKPERIVAFDEGVASILNAYGEQPVLIGADKEEVDTYPWLQGKFTGEFEDLWADGASALELVASYEPDLLIPTGTYDVSEAEYPDFSAIAPTFVGTTEAISPTQDLIKAYGALLGKPDEGQKIIDEMESGFDDVKAGELAGLQGKSYNLVAYGGDGYFTMPNGSAVEYFGLTPAANQNNSFDAAEYSYENMGEFGADVLFLALFDEDRAALEADPLFQALPAVQSNSVVWLPVSNISLNQAIWEGSPLSVEYMREQLSPVLAGLGANTAS